MFHSPKKLVKLKRNIDDQLQAGEDPAVIKDTSKQTKEAMTKKILQPFKNNRCGKYCLFASVILFFSYHLTRYTLFCLNFTGMSTKQQPTPC